MMNKNVNKLKHIIHSTQSSY